MTEPSNRMTADRARDLARAKDPSFAVDSILAGVEAAARDGKYEYQTREHGFGDGACYSSEERWPELNKAIVKALRALGYRADVRVHEGQFVDLWLSVTWGDK